MANLSVDTFQLTKSKNEGKTPLLKLAITSPWQAETLASPVESPQIDVKNLVASPSEDMLNGDSESESSKSRGSSPTRKPNPSKNQSFIEKFKFKKSKANTKTLEIPMSQQTESMISVSSQASTTAERLPPLPSTVSRQIVDEYNTPLSTPFINLEETPFVMLNPLIPVMISVEYQPTLHNHTFRGSIGDLSTLSPDCIPSWILELIIDRSLEAKESPKLAFSIIKHPDSKLPDLAEEFSKLTANRMLRLKKLIQYIADKLKIEIDPECYGGSKNVNGHYMELYWNDKVMPPGITLATVKYVLSKGQGKDIVLMYLEKQKI